MFSGAKNPTTWKDAGNGTWATAHDMVRFCDVCTTNADPSVEGMAAYPEQVFVDGQPLTQVATRDEVTSSSFFVPDPVTRKEPGNSRGGYNVKPHTGTSYVIGVNPAEHTVEVVQHSRALTITAAGAALKGVTVEKYSPVQEWDYNDPEMMSMLTGFVSALGQQYDGDPRLAFITHGLVGFWGEGHTYPMNGKVSGENPSGENWMPSAANQNTLIDTWDGAFQVTPTLARYPSAETVKCGVGYHDDSFGYATMDTADWHFLPKLKEAKADQAWQQHPIGGEVYPGIQECSVRNPGSCMASGSNGGTVDINASIKATHASWLVDNWAFTTTLNGSERERTVQASAETGYDLAVARWRMRNGKVEVQIANNGVAPFYYNWNVEAVAINTSNGMEVGRTTLSGDLRKVAVGKTQTFSGQLPADPAGENTILVRVVNPLESGQPLRFSSAGQDQTLPGYLTLGRTPTK